MPTLRQSSSKNVLGSLCVVSPIHVPASSYSDQERFEVDWDSSLDIPIFIKKKELKLVPNSSSVAKF